MHAQTEPRLTWRPALLALLPALYLLVNATGVLERGFELPTVPRYWIEHVGLLWLCAALCWLGYVRAQRLAVWSFPALGIAVVMLSMGAGAAPLLSAWGLLLAVVVFAAAFNRPLAGRSWEMWLVDLVVLSALLFPMAVPANPGPPVEPANAWVRALTAALWLPQSAFFAAGIFGVFSIVLAWRLAPRAGLLAGLIPAANLLFVWNVIGDPAYALGMWTENRVLVDFMELLPALTWLVQTLAVVAARGRRARVIAFLLPFGGGLLTEAVVDLTVRPYASLSHAVSMALLYATPLIIALWLCGRPAPPPAWPSAPGGLSLWGHRDL